VEAGKIDLDAEVQTYVPYFPKKPWPVTVRQLLGHVGGISHYQNYDTEGRIKENKNTKEAIAIFENFDLVAEPGTKYSYSSYGYNLLGAVIEGASGETYGNWLQTHLWKPLEMNSTCMDDPAKLIPYRVRGYCLVDGKIQNSEFVNMSSRFAAGGTRSTPGDLLKLSRGLNDGKALSKSSIDMMWTSMTTRDKTLTDYGMGWGVDAVNGHFLVAHTGSQQETRTVLYNLPAIHTAIAAAGNQEDASPSPYARRLYKLITGEGWNLRAYPKDISDLSLLEAMDQVANYGMAYAERYQASSSTDPAELSKAFQYWSNAVQKKDTSKIQNGRQPSQGEPFIKMGSFMAIRLNEKWGPERMKEYSKLGSIAFFDDYIKSYQKDSAFPKAYRIPASSEKKIAQWTPDWNKTCTTQTRLLWIKPDSDVSQIGNTLKGTFGKAKIYPDLTDEFWNATQKFAWINKWQQAEQAGKVAADLYPKSNLASSTLAFSMLRNGTEDKIYAILSRLDKSDPDGATDPENLEDAAYALFSHGSLSEAIRLIRIGTRIHPTSVLLYEDLGELYSKNGETERAIEACKRALELDPHRKNCTELLQKLKPQK
jgi:CubicO group peptidase (beta-lactamase class C family)